MEKKIILTKDDIFDKNKIYDRKPIFYSNNNIKKLDEVTVYIKIFKLKIKEIEDIRFVKDKKI